MSTYILDKSPYIQSQDAQTKICNFFVILTLVLSMAGIYPTTAIYIPFKGQGDGRSYKQDKHRHKLLNGKASNETRT